jgi:hypothetical protein
MNLFEAVEGQRSENLVTQVLLVLLKSLAFSELQRRFYQRILQDGLLLTTEARQFEVVTQKRDLRLGQPDMRIEGKEVLVILENKPGAPFTHIQLPRYAEILEDARKKTKILYLVCPNHKREEYEKRISGF